MHRKTFTYEGKRYDVRANTKKELNKKVEEKRRQLISCDLTKTYKHIDSKVSSKTEDSHLLVVDWSEEYLNTYIGDVLAYGTYKTYKNRLRKHIIPYIGKMAICDVQPIDCQKILNRLNGYSRNYIHKVYQALFQLFEKARVNSLIGHNPATACMLPSGPTHSRRQITSEERKYILETADNHKHGLYILLMLYCGLRPEETSFVQGKDIQGNILHVRGVKSKNADRLVPIPEVLLKKLSIIESEEYLLKSDTNITPIDENHRRRMWRSFKREVNIRMGCKVYRNQLIPPYPLANDLVPYCLRHTYCTDLQSAGVPINVAKELMGHSDISLTAKIYTHRSEVAFENARLMINNYFSK